MPRTCILSLVVAALCLSGCSRDPKVLCARFIESGNKYVAKSQYDAASIQFRRAVRANPNSAEAHYDLALSLGKLGRWTEAYRELQATTQVDPKHLAAHLASAEILIAAKQNSGARQELSAVLAIDANNFDAHLLLGNTWLTEQEYKSALDEFATCQRLQPNNPLGFTQAGVAHLRENRYVDAQTNLHHAIDVNPAFAPAYIYLAQTYRLQGDSKSEMSTLQDGIDRAPKQTNLYLMIAEEYIRQGHNDEVPPLFDRLRAQTSDAPDVLTAIGDFYFRAGDSQHARDIFSQALRANPKDDLISRRLIEVALNQQDWDFAEKLNKARLAQKPKDVEGRLFEARLQFARGARAEAVESLEQLVHDSPELPLPHFYLGLAYAHQGESARAVSAFNDAVQKNPDFIWAYVSLGELYAQQGSPKLALDFANQALKRNPRFVPARLLEASALMQTGDTDGAIQRLRTLLAADSKNAMILDKLGIALADQKDYKSAEDEFEHALASDPSYAPALVDLLRLYSVKKRVNEMLPRVELQIKRSPGQSRFYEVLADLQLANKNLDDAEHSYSMAVKLNANSAAALLGLAQTHAAQGKTSDAINDARNLVGIHPDYLVAYVELGQLLERTGDFQQARDTYQHALERNDDYAPALNNLAWLYCEHGGNLDMALGLAQKAKAKYPNDAAISDTLAWIEYRKGMYDLAASSLKDVTDHLPQNALYQYHYGMALSKLARNGDARKALERAIQLSVSNPQAQQARTTLATLSSE
jgi:tetratricopeptide (TPR) repeat protein